MRLAPFLVALSSICVARSTIALAAPPDRTADVPSAPVVLLAGASAAMVPLAIGAARTADGVTFEQKNTGLCIAAGGLAFAPIMAHVAAREWARAAFFGAIPVASAAGVVILTRTNPEAIYSGTVGTRTAFAILFNASVFVSALGVVDAMLARDRARERRAEQAKHAASTRPWIAPSVSSTGVSLMVGGAL